MFDTILFCCYWFTLPKVLYTDPSFTLMLYNFGIWLNSFPFKFIYDRFTKKIKIKNKTQQGLLVQFKNISVKTFDFDSRQR